MRGTLGFPERNREDFGFEYLYDKKNNIRLLINGDILTVKKPTEIFKLSNLFCL